MGEAESEGINDDPRAEQARPRVWRPTQPRGRHRRQRLWCGSYPRGRHRCGFHQCGLKSPSRGCRPCSSAGCRARPCRSRKVRCEPRWLYRCAGLPSAGPHWRPAETRLPPEAARLCFVSPVDRGGRGGRRGGGRGALSPCGVRRGGEGKRAERCRDAIHRGFLLVDEADGLHARTWHTTPLLPVALVPRRFTYEASPSRCVGSVSSLYGSSVSVSITDLPGTH